MPRAFLITHRRYNGAIEEFDGSERDYSPERRVRLADYSNGHHPTSDGASECGSETSSECPEELYNLTKLAEVSLAAAAGTLIHPTNVICQRPESPRCNQIPEKCNVQMIPRQPQQQQQQQQQSQSTSPDPYHLHHHHHHHHRHHDPYHHRPKDFEENHHRTLDERTSKFFLERIENEREVFEQSERNVELLTARLSPVPPHPHHSVHSYTYHPRQPCHPDIPMVADIEHTRIESPTSPSISHNDMHDEVHEVADRRSTETSKSEESEDHECPDCGKKYSTSSNLARHRQTHRSLGDKKARRCPHCDKVYVSMPAFSMHVRTHNQGCKCHYCGKCFSRPWLLQGHIRTHTGEKPFKCTICNKAFADKSNLRAHIQTHSNTKPHVCERCGKAFALKSYLYKHEESSCMRAHHRSSEKNNDSVDKKSSTITTTKTNPVVSSPSNAVSSTCVSSRSSSLNSNKLQPISPCVMSSPTSVIVPRLSLDTSEQRIANSAFSAIIKHTGISPSENYPISKRFCKDQSPDTDKIDNSKYSSNMVIRTSVISPNPEHLSRFVGNDMKKRDTNSYDYPESANRSSTFSSMTLNLAVA